MIRDWKDKVAIAAVSLGLLTLASLGVMLFTGSEATTTETTVVVEIDPTPSATVALHPTPTAEPTEGLFAPYGVSDSRVRDRISNAKEYLRSVGSNWCVANYLGWLFWQGEQYQTELNKLAYWAALEEPCRQPTALCNDGWISYSHSRSGTCSWHGGVAVWY